MRCVQPLDLSYHFGICNTNVENQNSNTRKDEKNLVESSELLQDATGGSIFSEVGRMSEASDLLRDVERGSVSSDMRSMQQSMDQKMMGSIIDESIEEHALRNQPAQSAGSNSRLKKAAIIAGAAGAIGGIGTGIAAYEGAFDKKNDDKKNGQS